MWKRIGDWLSSNKGQAIWNGGLCVWFLGWGVASGSTLAHVLMASCASIYGWSSGMSLARWLMVEPRDKIAELDDKIQAEQRAYINALEDEIESLNDRIDEITDYIPADDGEEN